MRRLAPIRAKHAGLAHGLAAVLAALLASPLAAQQTDAAAPPAPASFRLAHEPSGSTLRIRGLVQADGRFFPEDPDGANTTDFVLRRVRFRLDGMLFTHWEYRFQTELAGNTLDVLDAFVELRAATALRVRAGRSKSPISLDRLQGPDQILMYERSWPTQVAPNRDVGVQVLGDLAGGRLSYAAGLLDGAPDGGSVTDNPDDRLEWVGRLFAHPFRGSVRALEGLGVGVAASRGRAAGTSASTGLSTYRTTGRATIFRYDPSAAATGDRTRVALQGYFYAGRGGLMGEWVRSTHGVTGSGGSEELSHAAWNVNASLALTDDRPAYGGLAPRSAFSRERGTIGALELAGRVQSFAFDRDAFALGLADAALSVREAFAWTVGLNWYPHPNARVLVNFERTTFRGGAASGDRRAESALFTRVQLGL